MASSNITAFFNEKPFTGENEGAESEIGNKKKSLILNAFVEMCKCFIFKLVPEDIC
jgi:hypothetical protein